MPLLSSGLLGAALSLVSMSAHAVPSFARQTGLACEVCHTIYPELTPFGRLFKLNGYTLTGLRQIEEGGTSPLKINEVPPLSAMLQIAMTNTSKAQPNTQNNDVEFPEQLSFFFAGEISPRMGSFMQITYDHQSDHFTLDNTDIRYADHTMIGGKDTIYGLTLNNNPTVEDPWNSTPAWGFPWAASDVAPTPAAATLVDGTLAQNVAGLGGYTLWDNQWYGDVTLYRSSPTAG
ncbi:MAG: cytochrome C, partial [Gammaproteobacteria bacterium]|nr:cytochrome C [Gammaproteobacteria bacterium]